MSYSNELVIQCYKKYVDMVYRICFSYLKDRADAEDALQTVFMKLVKRLRDSGCGKMIGRDGLFKDDEHEKAWLIVVATNQCKDVLKARWRMHETLDGYEDMHGQEDVELDETLQVVLNLPEKYKTVVYLHYYEGYPAVQIATMLEKPASTVRNLLHEARELLKVKLGGEMDA